jgi:putative flippase GtrA
MLDGPVERGRPFLAQSDEAGGFGQWTIRSARSLAQSELPRQAGRFGILTIVSASITVGLPILLHEQWGVGPPRAAAIAFVLAFVVNFVSLRRLVFSSRRGAGHDLFVYTASSLFFRCAEYAGFLLLYASRVQYVVALISVLALSATAKFFWYRRTLHGHG